MRFYLGDPKHSAPQGADIVSGHRTTTGTLFSVPAGATWRGAVSLNASVGLAATGGGSLSASGTGVVPNGAFFALTLTGLALATASNSGGMADIHIFGGDAGATVTYTQPGAGSGAAQANGVILP